MALHKNHNRITILTLIFVASVFMCFVTIVHADRASDAYMKAIEENDRAAAFKAQSYLAPPYCYDLNLWHGVKILKAVNGRVRKPSFPFIYQDMTHLKVRQLRERAGIDEMIRTTKDELELIGKISDWANKQWGHIQPFPYASWDAHEILDKAENGDAFWCTYKAALFVQACNAAGLTGRILGINPKDKATHTVTEVYINDFRKWMLVDPWVNCYFEREGIPLSALDFHFSIGSPEGIYLVFGENGRGTEYWDYKTGKAQNIPHASKRVPIEDDQNKGLIEFYYDIRVVMRNDHTVHPQSKENVYVDGFMVPYNARGGEWWGPQLKWIDENTLPQITCSNTDDIDDFAWPLNEVKVDLIKVSVPGAPTVLETHFSTLTPNFSRYNLSIDGRTVPLDGDVFIWKLKQGKNTLRIASINDVDRSGFPCEFEIEYDPSLADYSQRVTVKLENPGFEEADPNAKNSDRPYKWGTICSNALQFKDFRIDKRVKHSGKYSLRAAPAVDTDTGNEYAFIVKTDNFEVNAGTDVVYSIWLKADKENIPVDIALLEAKFKGLGTYVERVTVEKKWKKYELKCRLHNEINIIYVGFKVYTGTVWADDVRFEEVN